MLDTISIAKQVIHTEIAGLDYMSSQLNSEFDKAIQSILVTDGRVIICGMGKSGIIGKKIAASLSSTGTPSFFMHPGEAFHGDLGMVKPEDIFVAISNSGETDEVLKLLPFLRDNGNYIISITGRTNSTLSVNSHCNLDISVPQEACPLQLAPTSSTTATLVMGDALTVALMKSRNFEPENFARFHPGGSLGKKLLSKVRDEMVTESLPRVSADDSFSEVVHSISIGKLGLTLVDMSDGSIAIITDGDLRRAMDEFSYGVFDLKASQMASSKPVYISACSSIDQAYGEMEKKGISSLLVMDESKLIGILKK